MPRLIAVFFSLFAISCGSVTTSNPQSSIGASELRCEYLVDPIGIDVVQPRLSWKLVLAESNDHPEKQTAFQILVSSSKAKLQADSGDLWDTGKVSSKETLHHVYSGQPLSYGDSCWWKVRIWDGQDEPSEWSSPARFSVGPLDLNDWSANWIGPAGAMDEEKPGDSFEYTFEKEFSFEVPVKSGYAYVASIGFQELYLNGKKVGDGVLEPQISDLSQRTRYVTYDLQDYLATGQNQVKITAAAGWAGFPRFGAREDPLVRAQIDFRFDGNQAERIETDASWSISRSRNRRTEPWQQHHFTSDWQEDGAEPVATEVYELPVTISAEELEPNRLQATLNPTSIEKIDGGWRIDFGRSFTGWLDLPLSAKPGTVVDMAISERPDQEVTYNQKVHLVIPADGSGRFRHRFNYVAGRWLTVKGPVEKPEGAKAYLVHSDYPQLTQFHCSNDLLNRIHDTVMWTYQCLSLGGYVVDCPHRERLGYGGDAHATVPAGLAHFGLGAFYTKWMGDWRDMQSSDGDLSYTAPTYEGGGGPAWSGIVIQLPWQLYVQYGDTRVLEENWPMMIRWLQFLDTNVENGLLQPYGSKEWGFLGDWVPPGRGQSKGTRVDDRSTLFFNNCYRLWSLQTAARIGDVLGKTEEASRLRSAATQARTAIHNAFWDAERGVYASGEQPYLAFPLLIGLPPEELRPQIEEKLEQTILVNDKGHINAGIHGHALLLEYLTRARRSDLIYEMVSKTDYPSWGYMLENGATTIWEQWDGENSRCHSSFLGVGAWFIRGLAGICPDPEHPGYEHFFIRPQVCGDVTNCEASYDSIRGMIKSSWNLDGGKINVSVEVPIGTTATVILPGQGERTGQLLGPGKHHVSGNLDPVPTNR